MDTHSLGQSQFGRQLARIGETTAARTALLAFRRYAPVGNEFTLATVKFKNHAVFAAMIIRAYKITRSISRRTFRG